MTSEQSVEIRRWLVCGLVTLGAFGLCTSIGCYQGKSDDVVVVDSGLGDAGSEFGPTPVEEQCEQGHELCDGECVDPEVHPRHCGACGEKCPEGHLCQNGRCQSHDGNCPETPCEGFTYCEGESGLCRVGCVDDEDCLGGQVCNTESRTCECPDQQRLCGGVCFDPNDPDACGGECLRCPTGGGSGTAQCTGGSCELECADGERACNWQCVSCPQGASSTACNGGECVASDCAGDKRACGGGCVSCPSGADEVTCEGDACVATSCSASGIRACGGECVECPASATETTCDGNRCLAAECGGSQRACGGECRDCPSGASETACDGDQCVATACGGNQRACGGECRDCPSGATQTACDGNTCIASNCGSGQLSCGGTCVDCPSTVDDTTCKDGECVENCRGAEKRCIADACIDTDNSRLHCGSCDNKCDSDESCVSGTCRASYVYSASSDNTVHKIDGDGNNVWTFTGHTDTVSTVAVDPDGYVYTGSYDDTVRKISPSGNEVWKFTGHGSSVYDIDIGPSGAIYSTSRDNTARKISSSGRERWSFDEGEDSFRLVAVDRDESIYVANSDSEVWKLDDRGNIEWTRSHNAPSFGSGALATGVSGAYYTFDRSAANRRDASDGSEVWHEFCPGSRCEDGAVDENGSVYAISDPEYDHTNAEIVKLSSRSGRTRWGEKDIPGRPDYVNSVAVDDTEYVYVAGDEDVYKLDDSGDYVWSYSGHSDTVRDVAAEPGKYGAFPDAY